MRGARTARGLEPERFRTIPYDLLKELGVALGVISVLVIVLAAVLSSPDVPADTIQRWATADPVDFTTTATDELSGASATAGYGPPYNNGTGSVQSMGAFQPQVWAGVHQPADPTNQFILNPLKQAAASDPALNSALTQFEGASATQQGAWLDAYTKAVANATDNNGAVVVAKGDYGPVVPMMTSLLSVARSGGLDGLLLSSSGVFYQTDYSGPLLFMGDGGHLKGLATDQHLTGSQWGVMNETGRYPGQAWLWLFQFWYQIPPYNTSASVDLLVVMTMAFLSLLLVFVPFIPGLRDLPRWIPIHRLIWKRFYAERATRGR